MIEPKRRSLWSTSTKRHLVRDIIVFVLSVVILTLGLGGCAAVTMKLATAFLG